MIPELIVVASSNKHKIRELQYTAELFGTCLISPHEVAQRMSLSAPPEVEETADNYLDNALLKARAFCAWSGIPALGDDSGLEVQALGNRPGVYSARYAGENATDQQRVDKLILELEQELVATANKAQSWQKARAARFRCFLALVYPDGRSETAEGELSGYVLDQPRGERGFGYDPIIHIDELGATLAEVDFEVTCQRGFRAKAAKALFSKLQS